MFVLEITIVIVALAAVIVVVGLIVYDEVLDFRERPRPSRRVLEAEWRIHQIRGDARSQMWEEATRHQTESGE